VSGKYVRPEGAVQFVIDESAPGGEVSRRTAFDEFGRDELALCSVCGGGGVVDSGGSTPWGEAIEVKCGHCDGAGKEPLPEAMCTLYEMCELQNIDTGLRNAVGALILRCLDAELKLARLPADWQQDSSLETWFPITAERLSSLEQALAAASDKRKHTQKWYASHYGKLQDWARKLLPEPYRTQFFSCVANGLYDVTEDVGKPYKCVAGFIVTPSGYFQLDNAAEQILFDQCVRAEDAEAENERLTAQVAELSRPVSDEERDSLNSRYGGGSIPAIIDRFLNYRVARLNAQKGGKGE
jgi:hypothetical protein